MSLCFGCKGTKNGSCSIVLLCLITTNIIGCVSEDTLVLIPPPKVYDEGQSRRVLSQRSRDLSSLIKNIQGTSVQEISGSTESTQYSLTGSFSPPGLNSPPSPTKSDSGLVQLNPIQKPDSSIGLSYAELLRQRVSRDQLIMNYDLLYEGDQKFLDAKKRLVILRYDISILGFEESKSLVVVRFHVTKKRHSGGEDEKAQNTIECAEDRMDQDLIVYTVGPEYISRVSQESLVTAVAHTYEARGGAPIQAGYILLDGQYSNISQEAFLGIAEQPEQFAIYTGCPNMFMVAFGPRRSVEKRSWMNPKRIFGDTYRVNYRVEPGTRSVYVVLIIPADLEQFWITAEYPDEYLPYQEAEQVWKIYSDENAITYSELVKKYLRTKEWLPKKRTRLRGSEINLERLPKDPDCEAPPIQPAYLYPAITNTFAICSKEPVSSGTQVMIGPLAIPKSNILVLGKYRLMVTVNQDLSLALFNNAMIGNEGKPIPPTIPFAVSLFNPNSSKLEPIGRVDLQFTNSSIVLGASKTGEPTNPDGGGKPKPKDGGTANSNPVGAANQGAAANQGGAGTTNQTNAASNLSEVNPADKGQKGKKRK